MLLSGHYDYEKIKDEKIKDENNTKISSKKISLKKYKNLFITIIAIIIIAIILLFINMASTRRSLVDLKSDLTGGLNRTVTVYTANGDIIAQYSGKIDIDSSNGVIKFDYDGKRYIYYNCFIETIADIY